ncbi:MAG: hypothetical protein V4812_11370 [Pseudomonadota bacterium]
MPMPIKTLLQLTACLALAGVITLLVLVGLMFGQAFGVIEAWMLTGQPLAWLALSSLPEAFWQGLTGMPDAAQSFMVRSFLQLCAALGQFALLLAAGLFRWCCWR